MTAALRAGVYLKQRLNLAVDGDFDKDVKLAADKASEKIILNTLAPSCIPVLSEEAGLTGGGGSEYLWIVDPLDGSVNYLKDMTELTCVSVALFKNGAPVLGVIYRYAQNELFCGIDGIGAFLNDTPIHTSGVTAMKNAVTAAGLPAGRGFTDESLAGLIKLFQRVKKVRMLGAAAIMAAYVGCGRVDMYAEEDIRLWDIAAAAAIVPAAGGVVSLNMRKPIEIKEQDYKCVFTAFATRELCEDYETFSNDSRQTGFCAYTEKEYTVFGGQAPHAIPD